MEITNTELKNDFIIFWFDTLVDGIPVYRTWLDFLDRKWTTDVIKTEEELFFGEILPHKGVQEEHEEIKRIQTLVIATVEKLS